MAASLGHVAGQIRRPRSPSRARRGAAARRAVVEDGVRLPIRRGSTASMGERLLAELVGHRGGERADLRRVDAPRPLDGDVEARRDPPRPRRHDDDAVAEPGRLADVVGDEHAPSGRVPRTRSSSSSCSASRVIASRAPNGSSISRMSASWANARASAPRWRMPPDSWCGRFLAKPSRWTAVSSCSTPRPALGLGHAGQAHRQLDVGGDRQPREQRRLLEHQRRPAGDVDRPRRRRVEPGDEVEDRRLAAARRADEADELAARRPRGRRRAAPSTALRREPNVLWTLRARRDHSDAHLGSRRARRAPR